MERFDDIVDASAKARRKKDEREMRINSIAPLAPRTVIARDKSGGSRRPSLTDCVCVEAEQERLHKVWRQSVACVKAVGDEDDEPYDMHLLESCSSAPARMMRNPYETKGNGITDLLSTFAQDGEREPVPISKDDTFATGYSAPPRMRAPARTART